ncbi:hypothetical protein FQN57_000768 [Myotisia sp. PD_48]|nr:hypothetical protein FQN57_000768 [Myotisia sp. PD_48]
MSPSFSSGYVDITDIRGDSFHNSLAQDTYDGLKACEGEKSLPTMLLYDTKGLRLFEEITYLDEYYLTNAEIDVLEASAIKIAKRIPENSQLVELGSGNLRKIEILLNELERIKKPVEYFALDLSLEELRRTFAELPSKDYKHVKCGGLWGTYDNGLDWLNKPENRHKPTWILSMGSSIGNFSPSDVVQFLNGFAKTLGPLDSIVIGLDSCKDPKKVFRAYNDSEGVTRQFYLNGLSNANSVLGFEAFKLNEWDVLGEFKRTEGCHKAYYVPKKDVNFQGITIKQGERIFFEQAFKYTKDEYEKVWQKAGLAPVARFGDQYCIHILSSSRFQPYCFLKASMEYATHTIPRIEDFRALWKVWDLATTSMIQRKDLLSKPIDLRNPLIFYLGHIPTFMGQYLFPASRRWTYSDLIPDIHLARATNGKLTVPENYPNIFERGIDPDVDNPDQCHDHSEVPEEWPEVEAILQFQRDVRKRVERLLPEALNSTNRLLPEALWLGFEHEAMHLETFFYMLLQSHAVLPPPQIPRPNFHQLALNAANDSIPNEWFHIPEQTLWIGLDDNPGSNRIPQFSFGWDIEKPQRTVSVHSFLTKARPITNGEYARYLKEHGCTKVPSFWIANAQNGQTENGYNNGASVPTAVTNGNGHGSLAGISEFISKYSVRTFFGPVPLRLALDWPVAASYDELHDYAKSMGCRLPTFAEAKSIYHYSSLNQNKEVNLTSNETSTSPNYNLPELQDRPDTPPETGQPNSRATDHQPVQSPSHQPVHVDLKGCNVGFNHWHPTPVTQNGNKLAGQCDFGGLWEWTSSVLRPHVGFEAMDLYPGYTADFFDEKHNIMLGGSWVTHPRIAGRTTFVNWYQRNYPYVWAGARLVRDI